MSEIENNDKINSFFGEEYDRLRFYVKSKISDAADRDAEDLIQDVALKLLSRPDGSSPIENVAGFVYHAIRNKIIDVMRTRKQRISLSDDGDQKLMDFAALFYEEAANSYSDDKREALIAAIAELKPHYKQIIIAIDFEGFSFRELAEKTGIAQGTLLSRRHRALAILQKKLKQH
ncbi:MAG: RNA polymerase sigma factor [Schleiferiaceae bacterium]|jgi:RNA polymerase sigma-70 factor (ECF subfamily)|nr:RNA polymerase sigma factor [Schleiferiaceae bacterium]